MNKALLILVGFCILLVNCISFADTSNLRFGVINYYPPFIWKDALGKTYGFDAAIADAICKETNKNCIFVTMPFYKLFNSLNNGEVDALISAISITEERKAKFDFTIPYYQSTMSFISLVNNTVNLKNDTAAKIGTLKGSIFYNYLVKNYPKSKIFTYEVPENAIDALNKNEIDLILFDTLTSKWWVNHGAGQFKIALTASFPEGGYYGIAVKKGNAQLLNELNSSLQQLFKNGSYQQIRKIYLPFNH